MLKCGADGDELLKISTAELIDGTGEFAVVDADMLRSIDTKELKKSCARSTRKRGRDCNALMKEAEAVAQKEFHEENCATVRAYLDHEMCCSDEAVDVLLDKLLAPKEGDFDHDP